MGAHNVEHVVRGTKLSEAFEQLQRQECNENGRGSYAGHIGIKPGFVEVQVPKGMTAREMMDIASGYRDMPTTTDRFACERAQKIYDDKWGPALALKVKDGEWLVGGFVSS